MGHFEFSTRTPCPGLYRHWRWSACRFSESPTQLCQVCQKSRKSGNFKKIRTPWVKNLRPPRRQPRKTKKIKIGRGPSFGGSERPLLSEFGPSVRHVSRPVFHGESDFEIKKIWFSRFWVLFAIWKFQVPEKGAKCGKNEILSVPFNLSRQTALGTVVDISECFKWEFRSPVLKDLLHP